MATPLPPSKDQLPNHPAYHMLCNGEQAEDKLRQKGGNCFLFRYSDTNQKYVLSVLNQKQFYNFTINIDNSVPSYSLIGTQNTFPSLNELVDYYVRIPLNHNVRTIGKPCTHEKCVIL